MKLLKEVVVVSALCIKTSQELVLPFPVRIKTCTNLMFNLSASQELTFNLSVV